MGGVLQVGEDFVEFVHVGLGQGGVFLEALLQRRRVGTGQGALDGILLVESAEGDPEGALEAIDVAFGEALEGKGVADVTSEVG